MVDMDWFVLVCLLSLEMARSRARENNHGGVGQLLVSWPKRT